jgi:hypothetical protein
MLPWRQSASSELSEGYRLAGDMARQREQLLKDRKDERGAKLWAKLATYCDQMGNTQAVDDDQYQFQRDQQRHYREVPMTVEEMDVVGIYLIDGKARNPGIDEWRWAALELALGYLTEQQRACFVMVAGGLVSFKDVAELLDISEAQARTVHRRAKEIMVKKVRPLISHIIER